MNRSILIVIADFLLVSLLAFSGFEADKLAGDRSASAPSLTLKAEALSGNKDLENVLQVAWDKERRAREKLAGDLTQSQAELRAQENRLTERDRLLTEREKQNQVFQQNLRLTEQQVRQLEQEQAALQQQYAAAQTNLQILQPQLRREQEQALLLQQQLAQWETNRQAWESAKSKLAEQLQASETEKRLNTQQLATLQNEVLRVRTEKAQLLQHADKLADGVTTLAQSSDRLAERVAALATNSADLAKEVHESRPLSANTIFSEFVTNRVPGQFLASRTGLFGLDIHRQPKTEMILVSDGTNTFALCHVDDTPLVFSNPGLDWHGLTGTLGPEGNRFPISQLSFYLLDPRIVLIPVTADHARQLGCKVYPLAAYAYKFQDAVLVGAREGYYGECKFQFDLTTPQYLKMDRSLFRGLFGKFNPTRGDLVFSKTGELLGIMANSTYCVMIHNFKPYATIQFSEDVRSQPIGELLSQFFRWLSQLPLKLQ